LTGASAGIDTVTYTFTDGFGCRNSQIKPMTVNPLPNAGTISGPTAVAVAHTITLASTGTAGGTWTRTPTTICTVGAATGIVTGTTAGSATITYTVTNTCGTATATYPISVTASKEVPVASIEDLDNLNINVYPNPSTGMVSIDLSLLQGQVRVLVSDFNGRILYDVAVDENDRKPVYDLSNTARGVYLIKVTNKGKEYNRKVVIE
jgi:hypothetical protein